MNSASVLRRGIRTINLSIGNALLDDFLFPFLGKIVAPNERNFQMLVKKKNVVY